MTEDLSCRERAWKASICSCSQCDSYDCFELRHQATSGCNCDNCQQAATCLYYANKNATHSSSVASTYEKNSHIKLQNAKQKTERNASTHDKNSLNKFPDAKQKTEQNLNHLISRLKNANEMLHNLKQKSSETIPLADKDVPVKREIKNEYDSIPFVGSKMKTDGDVTKKREVKEERNSVRYVKNYKKKAEDASPLLENNKKLQHHDKIKTKYSENQTKIIHEVKSSEASKVKHLHQDDITASRNKTKLRHSINIPVVSSNITHENIPLVEKTTKKQIDKHILVLNDLRRVILSDEKFPTVSSKTNTFLVTKSSKEFGSCRCKTTNHRKTENYENMYDLHTNQSSKPKINKHSSLKNKNNSLVDGTLRDKLNVSSKCNLLFDSEKNTMFCASLQVAGTSVGKLSAEVMNLPYKEFEKSVMVEHSQAIHEKSNIQAIHEQSNTEVKYLNSDIIKKIKDIFNVCSCKVCECIASLNLKTEKKSEECNCKPCDCAECRGHRNNTKQLLNEVLGTKKDYNRKAPPTQGRRYDDDTPCSCKPCACIKCKEIKEFYNACCSCDPCQCIQCKAGINKRRNFIVAPVGEDPQRRACQCTTCSCFECAQSFGVRPRNQITHDMATDVSRHMNCHCSRCTNRNCEQEGPDTCNCDRHSKALSKPVVQDNNEYDIRNVTITEPNSYLQRYKKHQNKTDDTLVMAMSVPKCYNNNPFVKNRINSNRSQGFETTEKYSSISEFQEDCECKPCECIICRTHYLEGHIPSKRIHDRSCDICNYINSEKREGRHFNRPKIGNQYSSNKYSHNCHSVYSLEPCHKFVENESIQKFANTQIQDKNNVKTTAWLDQSVNNDDDDLYGLSILTRPQTKSSADVVLVKSSKEEKNINPQEHHVTPNKERTNNFTYSLDEKPVLMKSSNLNHVIHVHKDTLTYSKVYENKATHQKNDGVVTLITETDINNQCADKNRNTNDAKVQWTDNDSNGSFHSSASETNGDTRNTASAIISKRRDIKSRNSSCNSSGHDYSDYLMRFPRSTVETCVRDVIDLKNHHKGDITCLETSIKTTCNNAFKNPPEISSTILNKEKISFFRKRYSTDIRGTLNTGRISYIKMCQKLNSKQPCDCQLCDCDDCSFKVFKHHRCRCNCATCDCFGMCLSEDQSVFIRKNEASQTIPLDDKDGGQNERIFQPETNTLVKNIYPDWDHNLEIPRYNRQSQFFDSNKMKSLNSECVKNSMCTNTQTFTPIKYKSVEKTLREAKEFSLELVRLLDSYENANKNFDSMAKRFQKLHENVVNTESFKFQKLTGGKFFTNNLLQNRGNIKEIVEVQDILLDSYKPLMKQENDSIKFTDTKSYINGKIKPPMDQGINELNDAEKTSYLNKPITEHGKDIPNIGKTLDSDKIMTEPDTVRTQVVTNLDSHQSTIEHQKKISNDKEMVSQSNKPLWEQEKEQSKGSETVFDSYKELTDQKVRSKLVVDTIPSFHKLEIKQGTDVTRDVNLTSYSLPLIERGNELSNDSKTVLESHNPLKEQEKVNVEVAERTSYCEKLLKEEKEKLKVTDMNSCSHKPIDDDKINEDQDANVTSNSQKPLKSKLTDAVKTAEMMLGSHKPLTEKIIEAVQVAKTTLDSYKPLTRHDNVTLQLAEITSQEDEPITITIHAKQNHNYKVEQASAYPNKKFETVKVDLDTEPSITTRGDTKIRLKDVTHYKMYSKLINNAIAKCNREIWRKGRRCISQCSRASDRNRGTSRQHLRRDERSNSTNKLILNSDDNQKPSRQNNTKELQEHKNVTLSTRPKSSKKSQTCLKKEFRERESSGEMNTIFISKFDETEIANVSLVKIKERVNDDNLVEEDSFYLNKEPCGNVHPKLILKLRNAVNPIIHLRDNGEKEKDNDNNMIYEQDMEPEQTKIQTIPASKACYKMVLPEEDECSCTQGKQTKFHPTKSFNELRRQIESMPILSARKRNSKPTVGTQSAVQTNLCSAPGKKTEETKISIDSVLKVSDHTLIVKWKAPAFVVDVLGYELLIDGRFVQKVSPTRNMAVVTCLPHSEKVVLTVRAITSNTDPADIADNTASFVYQPRGSSFRTRFL